MTVTSTGARLSALAANRPPKPEPTTTTRGRPDGEAPTGSATGDVVMMNKSPTSESSGPGRLGAIQVTVRRPTRWWGPHADEVDRSRVEPPGPAGPRPRSRARRAVLGPAAGAAARRRRPAAGHGAARAGAAARGARGRVA